MSLFVDDINYLQTKRTGGTTGTQERAQQGARSTYKQKFPTLVVTYHKI